jgi:hypothetical protein
MVGLTLELVSLPVLMDYHHFSNRVVELFNFFICGPLIGLRVFITALTQANHKSSHFKNKETRINKASTSEDDLLSKVIDTVNE